MILRTCWGNRYYDNLLAPYWPRWDALCRKLKSRDKNALAHEQERNVRNWLALYVGRPPRPRCRQEQEMTAREDYEASCGLGFKMPPPHPDASARLIEAAKRCTAEIVRDCIWPADSCTIEDDKITAIIVDAMRARPDASAGLIEAAKMAENRAIQTANSEWAHFFYDWAQELRDRAADRSGK
jgi:hypothetical protein